jgi:hypothetical protein
MKGRSQRFGDEVEFESKKVRMYIALSRNERRKFSWELGRNV